MSVDFAEYYGRHKDKPAVIFGGGMKAPDEYRRAPQSAINFSINQHGCLITRCDYIVSIDPILSKPLCAGPDKMVMLRDFALPIFSPHICADVLLPRRNIEHNSAIVAAHCAYLMGCAPIVLIGMDCYSGGGVYWHTPKAKSSGTVQAFEHHVNRWKSFKKKCPDADVRSIAGPLVDVFPLYIQGGG